MNRQQITLLMVALALIGGTAFGMKRLQAAQKLGAPGIKTTAIAGSQRRSIEFPSRVAGYRGTPVEMDTNLYIYMPQDTSFAQNTYLPDEYGETNKVFAQVTLTCVLMGTDRTSIHKPQFCLTGQGWSINSQESGLDKVRVEGAKPYDLEVMKLLSSRDVPFQGRNVKLRAVYVYWFVADDDLTASHFERMWRSAVHLLKTGEMKRWAYVSCMAICLPGQEAETVERVKKFIGAAVPDFQLAGK